MRQRDRLIIGFLVIILAFILGYVLFVYYCWLQANKVLQQIKDTFENILPKLEHSHYKELNFIDKEKAKEMLGKSEIGKYNNGISTYLGKCCLSAYNLSAGYKSHLPKYIKEVKQISKNGYLLKVSEGIYVITYRGTISKEDLITDLDSAQMPMTGNWFSSDETNGVMVHRGFYGMWKSEAHHLDSIIKQNKLDRPGNRLFICGHSLGCATACFTALDLANTFKHTSISLYMIAPPRLGNQNFTRSLNKYVPNHWALINKADIIPYLPPVAFATIGSMWLYDNFRNIIYIDFQMSSMLDNHHLKFYVDAFEGCDSINKKGAAWCRSPTIQVSYKL